MSTKCLQSLATLSVLSSGTNYLNNYAFKSPFWCTSLIFQTDLLLWLKLTMTRCCSHLWHQRSLNTYKVTHLSNPVSIKPPTVFTENSNLKLLTWYAALKAEPRFATPIFDVRELLLWQAEKHVNVSCWREQQVQATQGRIQLRIQHGAGGAAALFEGVKADLSGPSFISCWQSTADSRQSRCIPHLWWVAKIHIFLMDYTQTQKQTPTERNSGG